MFRLALLLLVITGCRDSNEDRPDAGTGGDAPILPETTITSGPMGNVQTGTDLRYEFTGTNATSFECRVDNASFDACSSPATIVAQAGSHIFEVRAHDADGNVDPSPATRGYTGTGTPGGGTRVRIMAGNLTSGNLQAYEAPGQRIFQGLKPDIALIQEFNVGTNTPAELRAWVDTTFGVTFQYYWEPGAQIPNGIVSRYPILASGIWIDSTSPNREFAYAQIDVPGPVDLWAVSVHLLTNDASRPAEATELVGHINTKVPAGAYLAIGGDFNTDSRTETAVMTLGQVVDVAAPYPVDQAGVAGTNASRQAPYDWVMVDADLKAKQTAVTIGSARFAGGLVFDSRVYAPLADVSPVLSSDSSAVNMQHMGVVKDFLLGP